MEELNGLLGALALGLVLGVLTHPRVYATLLGYPTTRRPRKSYVPAYRYRRY